MRSWCLVFSAMFASSLVAFCQEDAEDLPPAPRGKDGVQITFLPPPMDGTIVMGIFEGKGKLVRVLHREATKKDFVVGLNGFITRWDGKDDGGQSMRAGSYEARGWMVGDLAIEGVAFHCNDWVVEDGPRYARVTKLENAGRDEIRIVLRDNANMEHTLAWNFAKPDAEPPKEISEVGIEDGKAVVKNGGERIAIMLADGEKPIAVCPAFGGNVWAIVEGAGGREVRCYSASGEFLRRLAYGKDEPVPKQIAASCWGETVLLLEENEKEQRVRGLALSEKDGQPAWKTIYQKRIVFSGKFEGVAGELGRAEPLKAAPVVKVLSKRNPLIENSKTEVSLEVRTDDGGSRLQTVDGLPLARVSDTHNLAWSVLVKEGNDVLIFQSDGSVVEEFKVGHPEKLMAFDAGEYELKR